ncbi:unnamed protein product [Acanthoscelides obtectus]|uniref:Uncharacterized protein n=1 Tax=Acanthoscelides obtectus TaxID=200917 RepID=A0A9P0LE22_ACAOB|nr:unnamed protein product [Acanthoscelides obtectus]CAK1653296.1 hypothetical protein AOBTE_LOCUS18186 [Acanthoscelides obtectus]
MLQCRALLKPNFLVTTEDRAGARIPLGGRISPGFRSNMLSIKLQ